MGLFIEMYNMHSGKFTGQGTIKSSLGLNGVGATVTNALS